MVENYPIITIVERYSSLLVDGYGGISAAGIKMALDSEPWIKEEDKSSYIRKIVLYLTTAVQTRNKEYAHGKENPSKSGSKR